jgi:Bacterial regulatory proteins, luxR family
LITEGSTNKHLAMTFGISEETVKRHLTNIFNKPERATVSNWISRLSRGLLIGLPAAMDQEGIRQLDRKMASE